MEESAYVRAGYGCIVIPVLVLSAIYETEGTTNTISLHSSTKAGNYQGRLYPL